MANPRNEDCFTSIANELIEEALYKINMSGYEYRILWVLWRKTYGWRKEVDAISIGQFQKLTGLDKRNVVRTLKSLGAKNIITKGDGYINKYSFNKDYDTWQIKGRGKTDTRGKQDTRVGANKTPKLVSKMTPTKEIINYTKENIVSKEGLTPFLHTFTNLSSRAKELALGFLDGVRRGNRTRKIARSRVEKIIQELRSISERYGQDNLIRAMEKTLAKQGYNWGSKNVTGYVQTTARNLFEQDRQRQVEEQSKAEKETLAGATGCQLYKDIETSINK